MFLEVGDMHLEAVRLDTHYIRLLEITAPLKNQCFHICAPLKMTPAIFNMDTL